jgi:hypothetical protein
LANIIDHQLKRLDHLQAIIQRLAGNSFLIKGWTLTLASAMLGFALKDAKGWSIAYLSILPSAVFWGLDGYYLAVEIGMRRLYNSGATALASTKYTGEVDQLSTPSIRPEPLAFRDWLWPTLRPATSTTYIMLIVTALVLGHTIH